MKKLLVAFCLISVLSLTACSKPQKAKTDDPNEIEKLRQKHQSMAERERADNR
jgi:hypothetical protein